MTTFSIALVAALSLLPAPDEPDRADLLVADFEGTDYGGWAAEGEAFGTAPARGTLPGQMAVEGFQGEGLVNSFRGGDGSVGTLTSPPFQVERPYLNFLIGGGKDLEATCIQMLVDGEVVRAATGPNDRPGGSERLDWASWDVSEFLGKQATLRVVDRATGGWGHINVDHIVQSDRSFQAGPARRELLADAPFLHLPVQDGAPMRRMRLVAGGEILREFEIELAEDRVDFWVAADLGPFQGKSIAVEVDRLAPDARIGLDAIRTSGVFPTATLPPYLETYRPRYHFTSRVGWLNDPNGLVYHRGEYHLFYQHNPYGWNWGNMHWGHAVSTDLVHWRELPIALYPRQFGDWAFSGSAVVDEANTSGFGAGGEPPLVVAYTSTGRGECIAYSNDRGRTWTEYDGNPVVRHDGRDPRLLWHEPTRRWVMALYSRFEGEDTIAFYNSPDLKSWTFQSRIAGFYECPDLFPIRSEDDPEIERWVLYAADGRYLLGEFDGSVFRPLSDRLTLWHGNFYAAQTFSNAPDGRRIQIGWSRGTTFPGMPFNQQMTVPVDLTLRGEAGSLRLHANPVPELATLRRTTDTRRATPLGGEAVPLVEQTRHRVFDIVASLDLGDADEAVLDVFGTEVRYSLATSSLTCGEVAAPLPATDGRVELRVLVDRGSIEVFGGEGRVAMAVGVLHPREPGSIAVSLRGGSGQLRSVSVSELGSFWAADSP